MENWKKALVVVAFLATIGGLVATQYTIGRVNITVGLKTKTATLQFVAWDSAVDTTNGNYLLQNITTTAGKVGVYSINLGTLAWHYTKTWTAAFGIVSTSSTDIRIKKIYFVDSTGTQVDLPLNVYLHADPTKTCNGTYSTSVDTTYLEYYIYTKATKVIDHSSNGYVLETDIFTSKSVGYAAYGNSDRLTYGTDDGTTETIYNATWMSGTGGTDRYVWVDGNISTGSAVAANIDTDGSDSDGANFVWVEIMVVCDENTNEGTYSDYQMIIEVGPA